METHAAMWISGLILGYVIGFFVARSIYRRATWPH